MCVSACVCVYKDIECVAIFKALRREFFIFYSELQYPRFYYTNTQMREYVHFFVEFSYASHTHTSYSYCMTCIPQKIIASHIFVFFICFSMSVRPYYQSGIDAVFYLFSAHKHHTNTSAFFFVSFCLAYKQHQYTKNAHFLSLLVDSHFFHCLLLLSLLPLLSLVYFQTRQ